jgi:hypothetical protein
MSTPVKLSEILDALSMPFEEICAYCDRRTGKVIHLQSDLVILAEDGEMDEDDCPVDADDEEMAEATRIAEDTEGRYVALPDKFEIDEYRIMQRFSLSYEDEHISDALCRAIDGRGAFRHFKDTIHRFGIADQWYKYRDEALKAIAEDWCEAFEVEHVDDTRQTASPPDVEAE